MQWLEVFPQHKSHIALYQSLQSFTQFLQQNYPWYLLCQGLVNLGFFPKIGFPISSNKAINDLISFGNAACILASWSWCKYKLLSLWLVEWHSNSVSILETSGPATIYLFNPIGLLVRPIAPPESLTMALFCSWQWSKACFVHNKISCTKLCLHIRKLVSKQQQSRMWTGNQWE